MDSEITKIKKLKIWYFPKGLVHGFGQKFEIFSMFLFLAKSASKMCLTIITREREKECLDSKIRKLKKSKNLDNFSKGVGPWFLSKI